MPKLVLFNKPFNVLSQFKASGDKVTLQQYLKLPGYHPAGRLDYDSEGLLLLTDDGQLQHRLADPKHKQPKSYWVQVEGLIGEQALAQLHNGVTLNDGLTLPADAAPIEEPGLWQRNPPVRFRQHIPTSWFSLTIQEGRNRQVRRMTASVGFPTLRLIRYRIGDYTLGDLQPGEFHEINIKQGQN
jgi:23S rRNA pseudouridine2457 synthase